MKLTALLFTPGTRTDRFAKATECGADGIIIDLEDAVPAHDKDRARTGVLGWLKQQGRVGASPFVTALRVNNLRGADGRADLDALHTSGVRPDVVVLPKVESAAEVQMAANKLPDGVKLICLIETVRGVRFVHEIAGASSHVAALAFGGFDLSAETGGEPTWDALLWPRTKLVHACAAAGVRAIDQPHIELERPEALEQECAKVRALGFTGKLAIHPRQCAAISAAFRPTEKQLERAKRIVREFEGARGNVAAIDGQMIDLPMYRSALRVIASSE